MIKVGLFQGSKDVNITHYINKIKNKNYRTISIDAEKVYDNTQHPFMLKHLSQVGIEGSYLNIVTDRCDKPTAKLILSGDKLKAFL